MNVEFENGFLMLEDELGALDKMSLSELQQSKNDQTFIDILIICARDGSQLAPFFHSLGIKNIIYFEFRPYGNNLFLKHLQDICMNEFSMQFYEEIFNEKSIFESFNHAKEFMITNIFKNYRNFIQEMRMFEKNLGVGPKLYPIPFVETMVPQKYAGGKIDDISSVKAPTNIDKYNEIILGRKKDLYDIIRTLSTGGCVNIFGEKGMGKTKFAQLVGYYMLRTGFKDGVFYFKLGDLRSKKYNSDLRELMKPVFGEEFPKEIHCYFKNKKMLLIFDDYDEIIKNDSDINCYIHIFHTLKEDKIPYIVVTKNKVSNKKFTDRIALYHKLQPLSEEEAREFLEFKFQEFFACYPIEEEKQANISVDINKIISLSKGYPKPLMKQYKELITKMSHGKNMGSPHNRSPFANRNSKGKQHHLRKDNRSTPDLRALSEKKKSADSGYLMQPIVEENEIDWKYKKIHGFTLEEDNYKAKSTSSVTEEESKTYKKKDKNLMKAIKMNKTISYSPQLAESKRNEILSPNITNSLDDFSNESDSEESSDDEIMRNKAHSEEDYEDSNANIEDLTEELVNEDADENNEDDENHIMKSFSIEHNNKSKEDNSSSHKNDSDDPSLRKIQSEQINVKKKKKEKGQVSGKQDKKYGKRTKKKFKENLGRHSESKSKSSEFNESEEEKE